MLENIKMLLSIASEDTSKDALIHYYINVITRKVLKYCNLSSLPEEIIPFIENKVVLVLKAPDTTNNIKSIQRGDTRLEYTGQKTQTELINLTDQDKKELNSFRKVRFI